MHVHLPKPMHGWREFVGEVGIIVIGVLIALAAEQLVEAWHWRGEVHETDDRMRADMGDDLTFAYERLAIDQCLGPRLGELRDELLKNEPAWPGSRAKFANDPYKSGFPSVYRTPARNWSRASWLTALNGEVFSHLDSQRAQQFAALFDLVSSIEHIQTEEVNTAAMLGDLAFAGPISAVERRANLKLVAKLDALDASMLYQSKLLLADARKAGMAPDPAGVRKAIDQQRAYRGSCVREPEEKLL